MKNPGIVANSCAAINCYITEEKHTCAFFSFPSNRDRCTEWVLRCRRLDLFGIPPVALAKYYTLCERHFDFGSLSIKNAKTFNTNHIPIPTLFDFPLVPFRIYVSTDDNKEDSWENKFSSKGVFPGQVDFHSINRVVAMKQDKLFISGGPLLTPNHLVFCWDKKILGYSSTDHSKSKRRSKSMPYFCLCYVGVIETVKLGKSFLKSIEFFNVCKDYLVVLTKPYSKFGVAPSYERVEVVCDDHVNPILFKHLNPKYWTDMLLEGLHLHDCAKKHQADIEDNPEEEAYEKLLGCPQPAASSQQKPTATVNPERKLSRLPNILRNNKRSVQSVKAPLTTITQPSNQNSDDLNKSIVSVLPKGTNLTECQSSPVSAGVSKTKSNPSTSSKNYAISSDVLSHAEEPLSISDNLPLYDDKAQAPLTSNLQVANSNSASRMFELETDHLYVSRKSPVNIEVEMEPQLSCYDEEDDSVSILSKTVKETPDVDNPSKTFEPGSVCVGLFVDHTNRDFNYSNVFMNLDDRTPKDPFFLDLSNFKKDKKRFRNVYHRRKINRNVDTLRKKSLENSNRDISNVDCSEDAPQLEDNLIDNKVKEVNVTHDTPREVSSVIGDIANTLAIIEDIHLKSINCEEMKKHKVISSDSFNRTPHRSKEIKLSIFNKHGIVSKKFKKIGQGSSGTSWTVSNLSDISEQDTSKPPFITDKSEEASGELPFVTDTSKQDTVKPPFRNGTSQVTNEQPLQASVQGKSDVDDLITEVVNTMPITDSLKNKLSVLNSFKEDNKRLVAKKRLVKIPVNGKANITKEYVTKLISMALSKRKPVGDLKPLKISNPFSVEDQVDNNRSGALDMSNDIFTTQSNDFVVGEEVIISDSTSDVQVNPDVLSEFPLRLPKRLESKFIKHPIDCNEQLPSYVSNLIKNMFPFNKVCVKTEKVPPEDSILGTKYRKLYDSEFNMNPNEVLLNTDLKMKLFNIPINHDNIPEHIKELIKNSNGNVSKVLLFKEEQIITRNPEVTQKKLNYDDIVDELLSDNYLPPTSEITIPEGPDDNVLCLNQNELTASKIMVPLKPHPNPEFLRTYGKNLREQTIWMPNPDIFCDSIEMNQRLSLNQSALSSVAGNSSLYQGTPKNLKLNSFLKSKNIDQLPPAYTKLAEKYVGLRKETRRLKKRLSYYEALRIKEKQKKPTPLKIKLNDLILTLKSYFNPDAMEIVASTMQAAFKDLKPRGNRFTDRLKGVCAKIALAGGWKVYNYLRTIFSLPEKKALLRFINTQIEIVNGSEGVKEVSYEERVNLENLQAVNSLIMQEPDDDPTVDVNQSINLEVQPSKLDSISLAISSVLSNKDHLLQGARHGGNQDVAEQAETLSANNIILVSGTAPSTSKREASELESPTDDINTLYKLPEGPDLEDAVKRIRLQQANEILSYGLVKNIMRKKYNKKLGVVSTALKHDKFTKKNSKKPQSKNKNSESQPGFIVSNIANTSQGESTALLSDQTYQREGGNFQQVFDEWMERISQPVQRQCSNTLRTKQKSQNKVNSLKKKKKHLIKSVSASTSGKVSFDDHYSYTRTNTQSGSRSINQIYKSVGNTDESSEDFSLDDDSNT